jgi:pSer/pThr/pTyr-binding forkhead associated (FHA) protein
MAQEGSALGYLVVNDGGPERQVPIFDQLFVGRECGGISEARRLVLDDPEVSRTHLEIRLDVATDQAFVIDTSTNGTLLNGIRLERAVPRPIKPGDEIRIGDIALEFRSQLFAAAKQAGASPGLTRTRISQTAMVLVVGDIINYSTMSQVTDEQVIAHSLHTLWHEVGAILQAHYGTLNHYAGDAIFAIWEASRFTDAADRAIDFALAHRRADHGPHARADPQAQRGGFRRAVGLRCSDRARHGQKARRPLPDSRCSGSGGPRSAQQSGPRPGPHHIAAHR